MHWNPEITLGSVLETLSILIALAAAFVKFGKLEQKVNIMYKWFEDVVLGERKPTVKEVSRDQKFFGAE